VIDNFSTGRRDNLAPFFKDIQLVEGDIRSLDVLRSAMSSSASASTSAPRVDFVLHQAALPSVPRSVQDPVTTHEVNATGTLNVLIAARDCGVKRVVYASSSSIYGDSEELPKHEAMTPNPLSPYACAKLAGEHYCRVFSRLYGLETVALRYFNVFGPRQDPTSQYAAVIPKFIAAIREGRQPVIYGDGEQSRDFTPVANVVAANLAACAVRLPSFVPSPSSPSPLSETKDQTTKDEMAGRCPFLLSNVAVGERFTLNFLVSEICRITRKRVEPIYDRPRPGDVKHSLASVDVLKNQLGLRQFTTFAEGLAKLCAATGPERT
jgi:nucleoside-diphosphate-sugar epimerase